MIVVKIKDVAFVIIMHVSQEPGHLQLMSGIPEENWAGGSGSRNMLESHFARRDSSWIYFYSIPHGRGGWLWSPPILIMQHTHTAGAGLSTYFYSLTFI